MVPFLGVVGCAADGVDQIGPRLIEPMLRRGWGAGVTLTPTAATWLDAEGSIPRLRELTGLPVRRAPRLPSEAKPHPVPDCYVVTPATANTVAKLGLGLADNQALTQVCEAIGGGDVPVIVFPRINAAHAAHPAWPQHIAALRKAGVTLITGEDVWPLHRPREGSPDRELPWSAIIEAIETNSPKNRPG
nr:flavoprotein [Sciscionella marina]